MFKGFFFLSLDILGIEDNDVDNESEPDLSKYGFSIDQPGSETNERSWYQKWQPYMWKLTEDPKSSKKAKVGVNRILSIIFESRTFEISMYYSV